LSFRPHNGLVAPYVLPWDKEKLKKIRIIRSRDVKRQLLRRNATPDVKQKNVSSKPLAGGKKVRSVGEEGGAGRTKKCCKAQAGLART